MRCFGGFFRARVNHGNLSSIAGASGPALSTSEEASAASCSPAACALPKQQHCTETRQQHPTVISTSAELPSALQCELPSSLCNGSTAADQQAFTASSCSIAPSASSFASSQAGLKPATPPGNRMSRQNSQQGGGLHPGQSQRQWSNSLSKQASFERKDSCSGLMVNDTSFSWDYIEPQAGGKDFLGQRKKDVRSSLDWDFQNELPLAVTRRSKEYGEERPRNPMGGLVAAGRSYSGSTSDHGSMV